MSSTQPKASPLIFKLLIGIAVISVMAFAIVNSNLFRPRIQPEPAVETAQTEQPSVRQVSLTTNLENGIITIRNDNDFDWTNTKITVTNGPLNQFSLQAGTIKAGETQNYPLSKFRSIDGEIFNTLKHVPKQIVVYADNAAGGKPF